MKKYWKDSVTNLHRIYRVAEYLLKRQKIEKIIARGEELKTLQGHDLFG